MSDEDVDEESSQTTLSTFSDGSTASSDTDPADSRDTQGDDSPESQNSEQDTPEDSDEEERPTATVESPDVENVSKETLEQLNPRQQHVYLRKIKQFREWMRTVGKDPEEGTGLAQTTVKNYTWRLDNIYRQVWEIADETYIVIPTNLADDYLESLDADEVTKENGDPYSGSHKRKTKDTLEKYYRWRETQDDTQWESTVEFSDDHGDKPDKFTREERHRLRQACLEYGTLPSYKDCSAVKRDRLKAHLAQRLGISKDSVGPEEWRRVNKSFERCSLVWITLEAGLRPVEVNRANIDWVRSDKAALEIPRELAAKNRETWEPAISRETAEVVEAWLEERSHLPRYDGRNALWLTRHGNRWDSSALNYLLDNLCEIADIDTDNRRICWYSIRHSLGTHMVEEGGLEPAREQLRHKSISSTTRYSDPTLETRRDIVRSTEVADNE